jgi:protoporphyrinogen/coproporphyrinogen III oxidase
MRLLREPWIRPREDAADESVASFVSRRFGAEIVRVLVAPLLGGIFAGDAERLSIAAVFPSLRDLERRHGSVVRGMFRGGSGEGRVSRTLLSFRDGLETLPRRLAERLGGVVRLATRVDSLEAETNGSARFRLSVSGPAGAERIAASAVVVATESVRAASLLGRVAPDAAQAIAGIGAPPLAVVGIGLRRSDVAQSLDGFGFLVPRGEGLRVLGCVWGSGMFPGRAPEGFASMTAFVGGATDPEGAKLADEDVARVVESDLGRALGAHGKPRVLLLERYARAIPQYELGHPERVAAIERSVGAVDGLFLAANFLDGISVGDCVRRADAAAAAVQALSGGASR